MQWILAWILADFEETEAVARRYFVKKVFLKISQDSLEKTFLIKMQAPGLQLF